MSNTTHGPRNGADALCDTLLAGGVDVCFSNPGTSEMHFVAALDRKPQMRCVLGLFEGVVTGAADGYARMVDKPACTLLHLGPGLANGLANVHNAKRAHTPMVNIVGDHATYHLQHDAPLTSDIEMLARPMSHWVHTTKTANDVSQDAARAIEAANTAPGQIATLILPADAAWGEASGALVTPAKPTARAKAPAALVKAAAEAIRSGKRVMLLLSDEALRAQTLLAAGRIVEATGIRMLAQQSNKRIERGAGRVVIDRVPYPVDQATALLKDVEVMILVGAKAPVGFFAYPGKPSVMTPPGCTIIELAAREQDLGHALNWLADELRINSAAMPKLAELSRPGLPTGKLTPDSVLAAVTALMPDNAIIADESVTAGRSLFQRTAGAPPHDFLQLTGGAIGLGLPMSVGAAIACPDRKVISLQADGSGMYTVQALWTLARENLDCVVTIFANRSYAILHHELRNVGAGVAGKNARAMLDLDNPALDWVSMAKGMGVEACRATTGEEYSTALRNALSRKGPYLIEALVV
jgi:acetolactate synthase I/II/III large subunit